MEEQSNKKTRNAVLMMSVSTAFITSFMGSALNLSTPNIAGEFGVSAAVVGWIVTAFTLTVAAFSTTMGKLADFKGRRKILISGLVIFTGVSFACMFSKNIQMLIIFRIIEGFGSAMIFATNFAILTSVYPPENRGKALGLGLAAVYTGLSAGPVIGGILNNAVGWRSIFIVACAGGLVALISAIRGVPKDSINAKVEVDKSGNILFVVGIIGILYGLTNLSVSKYAWIIFLAGVICFALFILIEVRKEKTGVEPLIRISMFTSDSVFALSNFASLLNYGATFAISYLMSIYLQVVMGYSSQIAGLILIFLPATQAIFSPFMGNLSDKVAAYKLATAGMTLCVVGLFMFSFVSVNTPLAYIIFILLIVGFGFALFASPNTSVILSRVSKKDYSIATAMNSTMRTIGQSFSMAVVTVIVGICLGNAELSTVGDASLASTERICFRVFTVICFFGILMSMKRGKKKHN